MKAVNHYIVIDMIKDEPVMVGGLLLTEKTDEDNRYLNFALTQMGPHSLWLHMCDDICRFSHPTPIK